MRLSKYTHAKTIHHITSTDSFCFSTIHEKHILECIAAIHQFAHGRRGHKRRGGRQRHRESVDGARGDGGGDLSDRKRKEKEREREKDREKQQDINIFHIV